jgi:hypothetical protein
MGTRGGAVQRIELGAVRGSSRRQTGGVGAGPGETLARRILDLTLLFRAGFSELAICIVHIVCMRGARELRSFCLTLWSFVALSANFSARIFVVRTL